MSAVGRRERPRLQHCPGMPMTRRMDPPQKARGPQGIEVRPRSVRAGGHPRARTIPLAELSPAELARWRELADAAAEPNPFFEPEFVVSVAAAVPARDLGVLVVEAGDEWIGAMPVRRASSWRRVPLAGTLSWKSSYTYLGLPLVHRDWVDVAARTLLQTSIRGRRYLGLELLAGDGPVAVAIEQGAAELGLSRTVLRSYERAALRQRTDPSEYVRLKPKRETPSFAACAIAWPRRCSRRSSRTTKRAAMPRSRSSCGSRPPGGSSARARRWRRSRATARCFARYCASFGERGRLQLLTLKADEQTLAAKCNLLAGDVAFCFKIAFDQAWSKYSPGIRMELANIDFFHGNPALKWMDSCAEPTNEMINRLWPDRRPIEVTAITGGGAGKATDTTLRAAVQTGAA